MPNPNPKVSIDDKIRSALAQCLQDAALAQYYEAAPEGARRYIEVRFFAMVNTDRASLVNYRIRRLKAARQLTREDFVYLLQRERDLEEIKFLKGVLAEKTAPRTQAKKGGFPVGPVLALVVVGVIAGCGWWMWRNSRSVPPPPPPVAAPEPEVVPLPKPRPVATQQVAAVEQPVATQEVVKVEGPDPVKQAAEIEAARDGGKTLNGLGGIQFGQPAKGSPLGRRELYPGRPFDEAGYGYGYLGPELKKAFAPFSPRPTLWVSIDKANVYEMEFTRPGTLDPTNGAAEVKGVVETLKKRFEREPFLLARPSADVRNEWVFPLGQSTLSIIEGRDDTLRMRVSHEGFRAAAKREFDEVRRAAAADLGRDRALDSESYPRSGMARPKNVRLAKGTPRSFCGIAFGMVPLQTELVHNPVTGLDKFFVNYDGRKCRPFKGFDHGRADLGSSGGVWAVELYSDLVPSGMSEADYFQNVKATIAKHYQSEAMEKDGKALWKLGDAVVTLGPDPRGGFFLRGEIPAFNPTVLPRRRQ